MNTPWETLSVQLRRLTDRVDALPQIREATVSVASPISVRFDTDTADTTVYGSLVAGLIPGDRVLTIKLRHYVWVVGMKGGPRSLAQATTVLGAARGQSGRYNITPGVPSVALSGIMSPRYRAYRVTYGVYSDAVFQLRLRLASEGVTNSDPSVYNWGATRTVGGNGSGTGVISDGRTPDTGGWWPVTQFDSNQHHGEFIIQEAAFTAGTQTQKRVRGFDYAQPNNLTSWGGHMVNYDTTLFDGFELTFVGGSPTLLSNSWLAVEPIA